MKSPIFISPIVEGNRFQQQFFLVYIIFNKNKMRVQNEQFLHQFVFCAKKLADVNKKIGFYRYQIQKKNSFQFKRIEIKNLLQNSKEEARQSLNYIIREIKRLNSFSNSRVSPYIFSFERVIISYPYACFFHKPIFNVLANLLKTSLTHKTRINLMIEITKGLEDLHEKEIHISSLNPSTIVILSKKQEKFEIAFSLLGGLHTRVIVGEEDNSKKEDEQYFPPESQFSPIDSQQSNIWTLGTIFFEIWFQQHFSQSLLDEKYKRIECENKWILNLLPMMMRENPRKRCGVKDVLMILKNIKLCVTTISKQE